MEYRNLPHGDEKISVLGLGMGGIQGSSDSEIEQTICKAVDNGINFFDLCGGSQILLVTGGKGWYQADGEPARALFPGDVVVIPAGVKHWHGAAKDSWFSHLVVEVTGKETSNKWLEAVTDEEYDKLTVSADIK